MRINKVIINWMITDGEEMKLLLLNSNTENMLYLEKYLEIYQKEGEACGALGLPKNDISALEKNSFETSGANREFEGGKIYESAHGIYAVTGNIYDLHEEENNVFGDFGYPITEAYSVDVNGKIGVVQKFEEGMIFWSGDPEEPAETVENTCIFEQYDVILSAPYLVDPLQKDSVSIPLKNTGTGTLRGFGDCKTTIIDAENKEYLSLAELESGKEAEFNIPVKDDVTEECGEQQLRVVVEGVGEIGNVSWIVGDEEKCAMKREFKTSVSTVKIRPLPNTTKKEIKTIKNLKSPITVIGKAEEGEYIDDYKTDRWYQVECVVEDEGDCKDEKGNLFEKGYVLATLLHPEWIQFDILDDKNTNYWKNSVKKRDLIVLHFTGDNKALKDERDYFNRVAKSAHFIMNREGEVMQIVRDYHTAHHAQPENQRSIGIEIMNWGPAKQNEENKKWYNWTLKNEITQVYDAKEKQPKIWDIWNISENPNEQQDCCGGKSQYWQGYTNKQYESLSLLLNYLEEKFDIPHKTLEYPIPNKTEKCNILGFYFSPQRVDWSTEPPGLTEAWNNFQESIGKFRGIVSHKNIAEKYDPGPHLDLVKLGFITQKNLNQCSNQ